MKFLIAIVALACVVSSLTINYENVEYVLKGKQLFEEFKSTYGKVYETAELEAMRFNFFLENLVRAERLNEENGEPAYGVTQFMDLSASEFARTYLNFRPKTGQAAIDRLSMPVEQPIIGGESPASFDWRPKGAVTPVKDQGQCGSCWAFSATQAVESAWFLAGNTLPILAPQQIVSCDNKGQDQGCNGGDTITAYTYIEANGMMTEASFPYTSGTTGQDGKCKFNSSSVVARMTNFTYATPPCTDSCKSQNEETLATNIASTGPASICVNAGNNWQVYTGGVIKAGCPGAYTDLDHCVHLVGWNTNKAGLKYWIVKNSWAASWGEKGYINIKMGSNLCGIADEATFVKTN
jgi:C1A family cysteine protease